MPEENKRKKKYQYHSEHFKYKNIPFSLTNPDEAKMLEWLGQQANISAYIKSLILADMKNREADQLDEEEKDGLE